MHRYPPPPEGISFDSDPDGNEYDLNQRSAMTSLILTMDMGVEFIPAPTAMAYLANPNTGEIEGVGLMLSPSDILPLFFKN